MEYYTPPSCLGSKSRATDEGIDAAFLLGSVLLYVSRESWVVLLSSLSQSGGVVVVVVRTSLLRQAGELQYSLFCIPQYALYLLY
jgi:hypothetical protein